VKFILDLWPDLEDDATPEELLQWALDAIQSNPGLSWTITEDDGHVISDDVRQGDTHDEEANFPQTPEDARICIHGNRVWFGHECGLCDGAGKYVWKEG
jgi:hypothetical protein